MSLPRYAEYKESGLSWLGELPAHWSAKRIKAMASLNDDALPETTPSDFELSYVDIGSVSLGTGIERTEEFVFSAAPSRARRLVRDGDVIVSTVRTYLKAIAPIVYPPENLVVSTGFTVVRPGPALDSGYAKYALQSQQFVDQVISRSTGVSYPAINASDLARIELPAPPKNEQFTIAAFLDHETGKIDALIAEQEKLLTLLAEKRQATISHAVTRGLNPNAPMKDSGVPWLGEVPAHWACGGLTRFIGPVVDYRGRTPTKVDEGVFLVTARNVREGRIDYDASEEFVDPSSAASLLARGAPEIGDLLFTMEAPLGQVALIDRTDIALAQRIVKFRGQTDVMRNAYLLYWIMGSTCQARLETLATGSTALGIKASKLGMIECLAPPLEEQDQIVSFIKATTAQIDSLKAHAQRGIELLKERRSALIAAAVTGKIDVRQAA